MRTKTKMMLVCFVCGLMLGVYSPLFAQQGHGPIAESKVAVSATVRDILKDVDLRLADLDKVIGAGELDKVHLIAFDIRDMLMVLPQKRSDLPVQGKTALTAGLNKINQQAGLLDKFGDAKNLAQTKMVFMKFKEEIGKIKEIPDLNP
jgi:hypothetical protein